MRQNGEKLLSMYLIDFYPPLFASLLKDVRRVLKQLALLVDLFFRVGHLHNLPLGITQMILCLIHTHIKSDFSNPSKILNRLTSSTRDCSKS